jgi:hypothetical protein
MAASGRKNADAALIAALAAGMTGAEAARAAGVSERTVDRRLSDPTFRARVSEAQAAALGRAISQLGAGATRAATTLLDLLDSASSETVKLSAAVKILELAGRLRMDIQVEQELADLRAQVAALRGPGLRTVG